MFEKALSMSRGGGRVLGSGKGPYPRGKLACLRTNGSTLAEVWQARTGG